MTWHPAKGTRSRGTTMAAQLDAPILPRSFYRYRRITDETIDREIDAIKDGYLWLSQYKALNDPMEGTFETTRRVKGNKEYKRLASEILHAKRNIGICCFSDTRHSELMWVHYTLDYRGICVAYRPMRLIKA